MYAIRTSGKFLNVRYFLDPNTVFGVAISSKPKSYKTAQEAEQHLVRVREYFAAMIAHVTKISQEAHTRAARAQNRVIKLKAELEVLVELPYKDVHVEVGRKLKELERRESDAVAESDAALDYGRTLKRLEKLAAADYAVASVRQVVDTVAV